MYYEALCPDSIRFISHQLYPSCQLISDYLNVQLVPFGFATISNSSDGTLNFTCQHGPKECYANEVQACAIYVNSKNSLDFINCAESSDDPSSDTYLAQVCIIFMYF